MPRRLSFCLLVFLLPFCSDPGIRPGINRKDPNSTHTELSMIHPLVEKGQQTLLEIGGIPGSEVVTESPYRLDDFEGCVIGTDKGLLFRFGKGNLNGLMYFGFIPIGDSKYPHPVFFRKTAIIENGEAFIPVRDQLIGVYDMVNWQERQFGLIGFRITDEKGALIYDGRVAFKGKGPFTVAPTMIEGPWLQKVQPGSLTISFETDQPCKSQLHIDGRIMLQNEETRNHEFRVEGLKPGTTYPYTVEMPDYSESYSLKTAPRPGTRGTFRFAFASDSRGGSGGGERELYGTNAYILKKIFAVAAQNEVVFFQFSGDLISGYLSDPEAIRLQYRNFKHVVEPFAHYFPIYFAMGNHELVMKTFKIDGKKYAMDQMPFSTHSAEAVFAGQFNQYENGPTSEDGSHWDPDLSKTDFPSYAENVFYYQYDNVGIIVMNSDYWYAPYISGRPESGGNLHGYIMDNQLSWLEKTIATFENNPEIDHVFVTLHTPIFPNGGHVEDDMWYGGSNLPRPSIHGSPVEKGIIQRRDQLLNLIVNQSEKTVAILTGDEHNYCKTRICDEMKRYPKDYPHEKTKLRRSVYQINNGAAGAPYYTQENTPWSEMTSGFTTQNAVVVFEVTGASIQMNAINPDTLEHVDSLILR